MLPPSKKYWSRRDQVVAKVSFERKLVNTERELVQIIWDVWKKKKRSASGLKQS